MIICKATWAKTITQSLQTSITLQHPNSTMYYYIVTRRVGNTTAGEHK